MARTKRYPGLDHPSMSHLSEIIRHDHQEDPEYPMLEELAAVDLRFVEDLRCHREDVERPHKEDEDSCRLLLSGMLAKEETFSRRELVKFARRLGIHAVDSDVGSGTARTRKLKELEKQKEQRKREFGFDETKRPSQKTNTRHRSSEPRSDPTSADLEFAEEHDTLGQELAIPYGAPKRTESRTSKVLQLNKTDMATSVTRSRRNGKNQGNFIRRAVVPEEYLDKKIKRLPQRARLASIDNKLKRMETDTESKSPRKRFLESLLKRPVFYHPNGKERNLKARERKLFLEEDEWTASVTPISVTCKACGFKKALDSRSTPGYDTAMWMKHRRKCPAIYAAWLKRNGEIDNIFDGVTSMQE